MTNIGEYSFIVLDGVEIPHGKGQFLGLTANWKARLLLPTTLSLLAVSH